MGEYENPNQRGLRAMIEFFTMAGCAAIAVGGLIVAGIVWAVWAWTK